jgi:hypothetical protein
MFNEKSNTIVIIPVFYFEAIKRFLENYERFNPGIKHDILFSYNYYKTDYSGKYFSSDEDRINILELLINFQLNYKENSKILLRKNIGEDIGALREGYLHVKNQYEYYMFINEFSVILGSNWLKYIIDVYDEYPNCGASVPQVGNGMHPPDWYIKTTWWSMKNSCINQLNWPEPFNKNDCNNQEHQLFYPHVKSVGMDVVIAEKSTELLMLQRKDQSEFVSISRYPEKGIIY